MMSPVRYCRLGLGAGAGAGVEGVAAAPLLVASADSHLAAPPLSASEEDVEEGEEERLEEAREAAPERLLAGVAVPEAGLGAGGAGAGEAGAAGAGPGSVTKIVLVGCAGCGVGAPLLRSERKRLWKRGCDPDVALGAGAVAGVAATGVSGEAAAGCAGGSALAGVSVPLRAAEAAALLDAPPPASERGGAAAAASAASMSFCCSGSWAAN